MRISVGVLLATASVLLCAACGDDDAPATKTASDAGLDGGNGPDAIPRTDASVSSQDTALPTCDRFDATSCDSGQVCNEVIEYVPSEDGFQIYAGCIDVNNLRGVGDPCVPWNDAYTAVTEEVYYDPCGEGLVCSADPVVRDATTCQPVCQTGAFGDAPIGCESESAFCLSVDALQEVCRESDKCDPSAQTGCGDGEACYLRTNDTIDGYLSLCLPKPEAEDAVADHEPCSFVNDCRPGSSCIGPVNLPPEQWTEADYACRPLCTGEDAEQDGGVEDDAGTAQECPGVAQCVAYSGSSLDLTQLPAAPYGQCER